MFRFVHYVVAVAFGLAASAAPASHPVHLAPLPEDTRLAAADIGAFYTEQPAYRFEIAAEKQAQAEAEAQAAAEAAAQAAAAAAQAAAAEQARQQAAWAAAHPVQQQPAPPAAAPATYAAGSIQQIIHDAFAPYGQTAIDWGERVARCESGYNPRAYNPAGPYYGLFQFAMGTFRATPYGNQDIYDPVANANAAAWKYGQGGQSAWGCN